MRWQMGRRSSNIEDRRGAGGGFGGGRGIPIGRAGGIGGGIGAVVLLVLALAFGIDPSVILQGDAGGGYAGGPAVEEAGPRSPEEDRLAEFVSVVLADTEDTWQGLFGELGQTYREPTLVLFTGAVGSACGYAQAASGPFYCPGDRKVYLDLAFFEELGRRFGAPGDFAQAYVVAHEVGHHVQGLLGVSDEVRRYQQSGVGRAEANAALVRLELQADCFAGVWAHHADRARDLLERGDVEEALNAAAAIGDDRLQRQAGRTVSPDSFTHGSSEQRVRWFRTGLETGSPQACDTFRTDRL